MFEEIRKELIRNSEKNLAKFNAKLNPNNEQEILGIRIPILKKIAKRIVRDNGDKYLEEADLKNEIYMEEVMLQGLIIGYSKIDLEAKFKLIEKFVKKINNWAINDTFCPAIKVKEKELDKLWNFILPYLKSNNEFDVRFAVVMLLDNFIIDKYVDNVIIQLDKVNNEGYYAKMAVAWTMAEIGIKFNTKAMEYLNGSNNLDKFTYNKTLQKMIESYRVPIEQKETLKKMKKTSMDLN